MVYDLKKKALILVTVLIGLFSTAAYYPMPLPGGDGRSLLSSSGKWTASFFSPPTAAKTTTYPITSTDTLVLVDGSSASFSTTLPTAASVAGKRYQIKRVDQTLANAVTIETTSSQTIDGVTTRKLMTQYEEYTVVSDGSNWRVISHTYPMGDTAYTPSESSVSGTYDGHTPTAMWSRRGDKIFIRYLSTFTGTPSSFASPLISLPTGLTINTTKLLSTATNTSVVGNVHSQDTGTAGYGGLAYYRTTTQIALLTFSTASAALVGGISQASPFTFGSGDTISAAWEVPVTNWEP